MSWSISLIGRPDKIAAALQEQSGKLTGQSKLEFDDALPHLTALVGQNFAVDGNGYLLPLVKLEASGSGTAKGEQQVVRSCTVKVEPIYANYLV